MIRLAPGNVIRRAPFAGGFVVDTTRLAAIEVDDATLDVFTADGEISEDQPLPPALRELVATGLRDGWLLTDEAATTPPPEEAT